MNYNWWQVHFVPNEKNKLISASIDGLICTYDTSGEINDDDHLQSVSVEITRSFICFFDMILLTWSM